MIDKIQKRGTLRRSFRRKTGLVRAGLVLALIFTAAAAAYAQTAKDLSPEVKSFVTLDAPVFALVHVRVIDGTGAPAVEDQTIIVADGKIQAIGNAASVKIPAGAEVRDFRGYTVIPGIVGMHDHIFYPAAGMQYNTLLYSAPRLYLGCGVTTIRTTGGMEVFSELELKKAILKGRMPGPKMHVTSAYFEGSGAFIIQMRELSSPEEARAMVRFWDAQGVDDYKVYMNITGDLLKAVVDEAHKLGKKVTGHLGLLGYTEASEIGIDCLEHGLYADTEFNPGKKEGKPLSGQAAREALLKLDVNGPEIQGLFKTLISHGTAITSTLPVFENSVPGRQILQKRIMDALATEPRISYLTTRARIGEMVNPTSVAFFKKELEFERAFVKAGGLLLAGPDPTGSGGVLAGFADQREIELLVEAGFTPVEAIKIATYNGALYLGELDRIGTLAAGKQADMVLIKGNPAAAITDIEKVETVFKDGIGYDSAKLIDAVRGSVGLR
jgi:imidazolonepropionase-like amidohydrolase